MQRRETQPRRDCPLLRHRRARPHSPTSVDPSRACGTIKHHGFSDHHGRVRRAPRCAPARVRSTSHTSQVMLQRFGRMFHVKHPPRGRGPHRGAPPVWVISGGPPTEREPGAGRLSTRPAHPIGPMWVRRHRAARGGLRTQARTRPAHPVVRADVGAATPRSPRGGLVTPGAWSRRERATEDRTSPDSTRPRSHHRERGLAVTARSHLAVTCPSHLAVRTGSLDIAQFRGGAVDAAPGDIHGCRSPPCSYSDEAPRRGGATIQENALDAITGWCRFT